MGVLGACDLWIHDNFWKSTFRTCHGQLICEEAENFRSVTGHTFETKGWTLVMLLGRFLEVTIMEALYEELYLVDNEHCGLGAITECMKNVVHLGSGVLHCCQAVGKTLCVLNLEVWVMLLPNVSAIEGLSNGWTPGLLVVLIAHEKAPLDARWDHQYTVTRVRGPVLTVVNQRTHKRKVVNRDKVKLVDPDLEWHDVRPRPTRTARKQPYIPPPPEPEAIPENQTDHNEADLEPTPNNAHSVSKKRRVSFCDTEDQPIVRRSARIAARCTEEQRMEADTSSRAAPQKRKSADHCEEREVKVHRTLGPSLQGKRVAEDSEDQEEAKRQCLPPTGSLH